MTDTILVDDDLGIQKQLKWSLTDYNVVFLRTITHLP